MSKKGLIVRCILILLFPVSFILGKIASLSPEKVERVYSRGYTEFFPKRKILYLAGYLFLYTNYWKCLLLLL